ncbi:hypothetical protein CPC08DRAFT_752817 [Agrocybe pediades]|nr:hypothetical protein CPC08DRAFT_752817 [Agrocybe pediades]
MCPNAPPRSSDQRYGNWCFLPTDVHRRPKPIQMPTILLAKKDRRATEEVRPKLSKSKYISTQKPVERTYQLSPPVAMLRVYEKSPQAYPAVYLWLGSAAAADMLITASLSCILYRRRTGSPASDAVLTRIICFTIQHGLVTSIAAILDIVLLVAFPQLDFEVALVKLYANTLMSTLNSRQSLNKQWNNRESLMFNQRLDILDTPQNTDIVHQVIVRKPVKVASEHPQQGTKPKASRQILTGKARDPMICRDSRTLQERKPPDFISDDSQSVGILASPAGQIKSMTNAAGMHLQQSGGLKIEFKQEV